MDAAPRRRRFLVSVRTRIVVAITVVAAIGLASVGLTVYVVERSVNLQSIESRLSANLDSARYIVAAGDNDTGVWLSAEAALRQVVQRMSPDDNTGAVGIMAGKARYTPGIRLDVDPSTDSDFIAAAAEAGAGGDPVVRTYSGNGVTWRYLAVPIAIEGDTTPGDVVFALVYDVEAELAEMDGPARAYLLASGIALIIITAVAFIVSTRLLRPLRRMRETAERVSGQSLSERLPVEGEDDVSELAATMNAMLDRLDEALDSQRRLLSDVGHELKTPITIVRGHLEVMDPRDVADVESSRDLAVDELDRMHNLVRDLGAAAALHGPRPVALSPVDAADLLTQVVRKAGALSGASVTTGPAVDVVIAADAERLTQALLQLAQNAVTHGGGEIVLSSRLTDGAVEFRVRDHGPGVPDEQKPFVFDRFHRGTDDGHGSGLGLNIVQVIAKAHGGSVRVTDAEGGGALFVLSIPHEGAMADDGRLPDRPPTPVTISEER
ncbi:ATP-binding protein [Microbacterium sp. NPDC077663]|uniref:sensor histidine kinase n=1 Tax=Microbacterium sp. NPDC077663 TaxID=3364189 RepID=UPI0037C8E5B9